MIANITITCFAASYLVALVLEASRLWFRSGTRGVIMLSFAGAGVFAHTLFLGYRAATAQGAPLSSQFDWFLVAAWILAIVYLFMLFNYPRSPAGLLLLPLMLVFIGVAEYFADQHPFPQHRASQAWGAIHGGFVSLAAVAVTVGFVAGVMYLWAASRLKRKLPPMERLQLPSLESLERVNSQALVVSVLMLATGFLSGIVLNLVNKRKQLDQLPWTDPVVWTFSVLLLWMTAAAVFSIVYRPARQGRKIAYLTVASFLALLLFFASRIVVPSEHGVDVPPPAVEREAAP